MRSYWVGFGATSIGVLILSPDSLLVRQLQAATSTILVWRGLLLFATVSAICLLRHRRGVLRAFLGIGAAGLISAILFAISSSLFVYSIRAVSSVTNTLVILGAAPVLAALMGFVSLKERPTRRAMVVILIVLLGIGLIFVSDAQAFGATLGNIYALGMALCIAANIVLTRATPGDSTPFLAVAGVLLALAWLPFTPTLIPAPQELAPVLLMGAVVVPLGFTFILIGPKHLQASEVGLLMLLEAVFGPLWVWIWLAEAPGRAVAIAGIVIVGTLLVHHILNLREMVESSHERLRLNTSPGQ
ncbi:MAG: DMT family transporter [Synechococcaceae cyanobacterium]